MSVKCEISFDNNPYGIYFPGQTLCGRVQVTTDKIKSVQRISLNVCGFASTHWSESSTSGTGDNQSRRTTDYYGREDYLKSLTYLIGSSDGNLVEIPIGIHTYNFSCVLPAVLPTSFEGHYGHIRYTVRAALERPWKFDQAATVAFTIINPLDLNLESPALRIPSQVELTKTFCCWPCKSDPLTLTASIPQSGYVPGQNIDITATLMNLSNVVVNALCFSLKRVIHFYSQRPTSQSKMLEVNIVEEKCLAIQNGQYVQTLIIPSIPPTNNQSGCIIIQINYEIHVEVKVTGCHVKTVLKIPITIGTVPLTSQDHENSMIKNGNNKDCADGAKLYTDENLPNSNTQSDIPPPSYVECFGHTPEIPDNNDKSAISHTPYSPRYPVYNFNTSYKDKI